MKKVFFIAVIGMAIGFTSCKKDYTCTCSTPGVPTADTYVINDVNKKDATSTCDTYNALYILSGGSCTLN